MRKFNVMVLTSVFCLLTSVLAYAGLGVSVSGTPAVNWAIGNIRSSDVATSAAGRWTATNSGDVPENIFIKVAGVNWNPGTTQGANTFVLTYQTSGSSSWSSAITNTAPGSWLGLLKVSGTRSFGLRFAAPISGSTATDTMTVTLTAQYFPVLADGEWRIINDEIVCVGIVGGYLMYLRQLAGPGTNFNVVLMWKKEDTAGQPCWDDTAKTYNYTSCASWGPAGACTSLCSKENYPAFSWVEDLDWQGYADWRLPDRFELKNLYDYGRSYISHDLNHYWSGMELSMSSAHTVYSYGTVYTLPKSTSVCVRAVRSGQW